MFKILQSMKSKQLGLLLLFLAIGLNAISQDKKPEVITDYYNAIADIQSRFDPLINDIVDEGHTARIFSASGTENALITFNDSVILYKPRLFFSGLDSIRYMIKDNENGLFSDVGKIYITVTNKAFDILNINNISAQVSPYGLLFWDFYNTNHYEFPKGSGNNTLFWITFYLKGADLQKNKYLSGLFNTNLSYEYLPGYYPGPVSSPEGYTAAYDVAWRKVWKLNRDEINNHIAHYNDQGYQMPDNISTWPGDGNGSQGQATHLAPYHDFNANGIYDPGNGDYPIIRGDQAIYFIYNDVRNDNTGNDRLGLSAEFHCMFYGFHATDDEALNNTVFINCLIYNRSSRAYSPLQFSVYADTEIGNYMDDYVGCDTLLNAAIAYNDAFDEIEGGYGYGDHPPAQSITLLNREIAGFSDWDYRRPYSFPNMYSSNYAEEVGNKMDGYWVDGAPIIDNGCGHPSCAEGNITRFAFPGDPGNQESWSMPQAMIPPSENALFMNVKPVEEWGPGEAFCIDFALTTARDEVGTNLDSYELLKQYIAEVQSYYELNFSASCSDIAPAFIDENLEVTGKISIYPNPATGIVLVDIPNTKDKVEYTLIDLTGRTKMQGTFSGTQSTFNISSLEPGIYIILVRGKHIQATAKIIKN
jgi:hypothetical protein